MPACNNLNEYEESRAQREARHALHRLATEDPAAARNMTRHMIAASILTTGVKQSGNGIGSTFVSGFTLTPGEVDLFMAGVGRSGQDHVFLAFDVDDACAEPVGVATFRIEGEHTTCYTECALWSQPGDGRAVIVPVGPNAPCCHLVARRGLPLRVVEGHPSADLSAGFLRARSRLARLVRSPELSDAHKGTYLHRVVTSPTLVEVSTTPVGD